MTEARPHRAALSPAEAAAELRAGVRRGAVRRRRGRRRAARGGPSGQAPARVARGPHEPRGRGPAAARARPVEQGDRRAAGDLAQDRGQPRRAHLREDRRLQSRAGQPVRGAARPDRRPTSAKIGRTPDERAAAPCRTVVRHDEPPTTERPRRRTAGPIGRLGGFAADHVRAVAITWAIAALVLAAFAPKVETALSGAGWQADGSESVQARALIQRSFAGRSSSALTVVVHSPSVTTSAPAFRRRSSGVERVLGAGRARRLRAAAAPGSDDLADGHTAVVTAGAKGDPTAMVAAAEALKPRLERAGSPSVAVSLTGSPAHLERRSTRRTRRR